MVGKISCKFKERCPSYSGWCERREQDFQSCVEFLIRAYEIEKTERQKVLYECDGRACKSCHNTGRETDCSFTHDVRHAKNFRLCGDVFVEVGD